MIIIPPYTLRQLHEVRAGLIGGSFPNLEKIVRKAETLEEACKILKREYGFLPSPPQLRKYLNDEGIPFEDSSRN